MYGTVLAAMLPLGTQVAEARGFAHHRWHYAFRYSGFHSLWHSSFWHSGRAHSRYARYYGGYAHYYGGYARHYYGGGLQCVAFVRQETGVQITGNAGTWWNAANGLYDRGNKPEPGAVLVFRGAGRMRLGHVAVVRGVRSKREIEIDHAHWAGYGIHRGVSVIDVSPENDWTAVRVAIREGETYGSIYPTYGFIYDRTAEPRLQTANAADSTTVRLQNVSTADSTPAGLQNATATDPTPARVQKASATESTPASVQTVSTTDLPEALDTEDAPRTAIRTHVRRHWRRLVARRHVIAEVAEQPAWR